MRVCYVPSLSLGCIYWRIENFAEQIVKQASEKKHEHGVHITCMTPPRLNISWEQFIVGKDDISDQIIEKFDAIAKNFDVLILQKLMTRQGHALVKGLKKEFPNLKIYIDVDDVIGDWQPSNINVDKIREHDTWAVKVLQIADGVIVTTEYLKNTLTKFNENIYVLPNCIQPILWKPHKKKNNSKFIRVGYVGAAGHDEDLKVIYRAMIAILNKRSDVRFVVRYGGFKPKWFKHHARIDFKSVAWNLDRYPQELSNLRLDVALAPVRDTNFNRCKSNIKWQEWASLGVPLVASNVEPYKTTKGTIWLSSNDAKSFEGKITEVISKLGEIDRKELSKEPYKSYNIDTETMNFLQYLDKNIII